jgi:uncharacterized protein YwbE
MMVPERAQTGMGMPIDQFNKAQHMSLRYPHIDIILLLDVVLQQDQRTEHLHQLMIEISLSQQKLAHSLHLQVELVFVM